MSCWSVHVCSERSSVVRRRSAGIVAVACLGPAADDAHWRCVDAEWWPRALRRQPRLTLGPLSHDTTTRRGPSRAGPTSQTTGHCLPKACPAHEVRRSQRRLRHRHTSADPNSFIQRVDSAAPLGYTTPPFPSLYWPLPPSASRPSYLYKPSDILRFTVYWTLLLVGGVHLITALWACAVQWRNWKLIWIVVPIFSILGGVEALLAGSIVGGL